MSRSARAVVVAAALLAAGCSLLLSPADATQCTTDRDCEMKTALRGYTCDPTQGVCVADKPVVAEAGSGCASTAQCTALNSGRLSLCKKVGSPCVDVQTARCPLYAGAVADPNAVVIGSILPLSAKQVDDSTRPLPYVDRVRRAADLAVKDFEAQHPGGVFMPDGKTRPFGIVHCDSNFHAPGAQEAFTQLVDGVGASALIVGADADLAAIASQVTARQIAVACSDCVAPLPAGPLAWRILPRLALEAPMAAWRVGQLESEIKAGPNPPAQLKVAVFMVEGRAPDDYYAALTAKLRFNGKSVLENGANFLALQTDDPRVKAIDHAAVASQLVAFEPDVIVVVMGDDFSSFYLDLIESKWPAGKRRPSYILTELNYGASMFLSSLDDPARRKRVSGTRPAVSPAFDANIESFSTRYLPANNFQQPDGNYTGFESFYALALAVLAARTQLLLDGPHISAGFERLRGGTTLIDFRPDRLGLARNLLANPNERIEVRGLWSELDWNASTRDFDNDVGMYCFVKDAGGGLTIKADAGPRLSASTGIVTGAYSCD